MVIEEIFDLQQLHRFVAAKILKMYFF